jgi:hypothetical protein
MIAAFGSSSTIRMFVLLICLCSSMALLAQEPLTEAQALGQIYQHYDAATGTAQWPCPASKEQADRAGGWPCGKEYKTVTVAALLTTQVREEKSIKTYVVASAVPAHASLGYDCHACAPAIGAAVFDWKDGRWVTENINPAIGFYGGWGGPPSISFVAVGPEKHGIVLSLNYEGQGYSSSTSVFLLPLGTTFSEVWHLGTESDNLGACDPNDKENPCAPYRASAAFQFIPGDQYSAFYDIEVISRGRDQQDFAHPLVNENWTDIYHFKNGTYQRVRHTAFVEDKRPAKVAATGKK